MFKIDKMLHFCIGYIISNIICALTDNFIAGAVIAMAAGAAKEYYDSKHGGNVENLDALATILGGFFGSFVWYLAVTLHG
jgi:hypothetical protein